MPSRYSPVPPVPSLLPPPGLCLALLACLMAGSRLLGQESAGVRLKELVDIKGVRDNQLHGIGLVTGLSGTGDKSEATVRMIRNFLASQNLRFEERDLDGKNVAMVAVTADLPVFAREGQRLPVQISCIGDAKSLKGGILQETRMVAADGQIYAVAQGVLNFPGAGDSGPALPLNRGPDAILHPTVATLGEGALVEREVPLRLLYGDRLVLHLKDPDFTTAHLISRALGEAFAPELVEARDASQIAIGFAEAPAEGVLVEAIAKLEALRVEPDVRARIVINSRTGTVVVGNHVRIGRAAISHGGLSLRILPRPERQRADPTAPGAVISEKVWSDPVTGVVGPVPPPGVEVLPQPGTFTVLEGATVEAIANALNAIGAHPKDLVAIFEALHNAGALHAELVVL